MISAGVVGATGYTGLELVRILLDHPNFSLSMVTSTQDAGVPLTEVHPQFLGRSDLVIEEPQVDRIASICDVVFLAVPHTAALDLAPQLIHAGVKVVDLSADYRLADPEVYEAWYGVSHTSPTLLDAAVYGLPEVNRSLIAQANLVASPGCYPTAAQLAGIPAFEAGIVNTDAPIAITAISGISGAGKKPSANNLYCNVAESVQAYGVGTHRHTPEIAQGYARAAGHEVRVVFTPHLAPLKRGLLATVVLPLIEECTLSAQELFEIYSNRYQNEPSTYVLPYATMPRTDQVVGSNRALVGVSLDERSRTLVATSAIDNLVKGSGGQSIQCANIMFGFNEVAGLDAVSMVV